MKWAFLALALLVTPLTSNASVCDRAWLHLASVSKHIEVFQPNEYTRYKRQTHPGLGLECQHGKNTYAAGEFVNSLNRPFKYAVASRDLGTALNIHLNVGLIAGEYGRTELEPLKIISPIAYLAYDRKHVGLNLFALPPARGLNDYAIFFAQFKIGF